MADQNLASKFIPLLNLAPSESELTQQAERNLNALKQTGELEPLGLEFLETLRKKLPAKAKLNRLKRIADKMSKVVTPKSACRSGCSHCCNISAVITQTEANAMAEASGRKVIKLEGRQPPTEDIVKKWFRVPCPFLVKGRCSVYAERPVVCRLQFNVSDDPYYCNTAIEPEDSFVTYLNLTQLQQGYMMAFIQEPWGDIRDFFPPARDKI